MTTLFRGTLTTYISDQFKWFFQGVIDDINYSTPWTVGTTAKEIFDHKLFETIKYAILNKIPSATHDNIEILAKSILNVWTEN